MALSVKQFRGWSDQHKSDFLKKYAGNRTIERFNALTPAQKRKVLANARARQLKAQKEYNDPQNVYRQLSPKEIDQQAKAAAALRYDQAENELRDEERVSTLQKDRVADYFAQFEKSQRGAQDRSQTAYADAVKAISDRAAASQAQDTAKAAAQAEAARKDAEARGAVVDPKLQAEADQAAANRKSALDVIGAVVQGNQQSANTYDSRMQGVTRNQGYRAVASEIAHRRGLADKLVTLEKERGDYQATQRNSLRQQQVENWLAKRSLIGKEQEVATDAALEAAEQAANAAEAEADRQARDRAQSETERHNRASEQNSASRNRSSDSPYLSRAQQLKYVSRVKNANTLVAKLMKKPGAVTSEVRELLQTGRGGDGVKYDSDQVTLAFQLWRGGIDATGVKILHNNGIQLRNRLPRRTGPQTNVTNRQGQLPG